MLSTKAKPVYIRDKKPIYQFEKSAPNLLRSKEEWAPDEVEANLGII
jgi:hypothetical protein